jgi:hypothetical protein
MMKQIILAVVSKLFINLCIYFTNEFIQKVVGKINDRVWQRVCGCHFGIQRSRMERKCFWFLELESHKLLYFLYFLPSKKN